MSDDHSTKMVELIHIFGITENIKKWEGVNVTLTEFTNKMYVNLGVVCYNTKNEVDSLY